jgi:predicted kinase
VIVLVTGLPASGKTTLARQLAAELRLPLLSKDTVKEALFDVLGVGDREWALRLSEASLAVLWSLAADSPAGAVVELWLDPKRDAGLAQDGMRRAGLRGAYEVRCLVPGDVAADRYAARQRHPGHLGADEATLQRIRDSAALMRPLGVGPSRDVDTTGPVDVPAVVRWLESARSEPTEVSW